MLRSLLVTGFLAVTLLLPWSALRAGEQGVRYVVPREREAEVLSLVAPYRTLAPVEPGTWFERIALTDSSMEFVVVGREPVGGPVSIVVRWGVTTDPAQQRPPLEVTVEGLGADTPANLRRSVEDLYGKITDRLTEARVMTLLKPVLGDPWGVPGGFYSWLETILASYPSLRTGAPESMGINQVRWEAVLETAPAPPSAAWMLAVLLPVLLLAGLGVRRLRRGGPPWEWALGLLVVAGGAATWWLVSPPSPEGPSAALGSSELGRYLVSLHRDFAVASFFTGVALLGGAAALLWCTLRALRGRGPRGALRVDLPVLLGLAAGSLLVRFGLGGVDLLTDGGSGFERVLRYSFGYGGTSLLVSWFLPRASQGLLWPAIAFTSTVAALAPVALYGLARALEFSRMAAVAAALSLLCWPLHAAMYTSDFLQGPLLTLGLLGLWCLAHGVREEHPAGLLGGAAIFGGLIWMRPEAPAWVLPYAAVAAPLLWRWRRRAALWLAVGYGALALGSRLLSYAMNSWILPAGGGNTLILDAEGFLLAGHAALPWWLWLGIPAGLPVLWRRHRVAGLVAAGGVAGYLSLRVGGSPPDLLEFFRYLTPVMAWSSLMVGLGLVRLVDLAPSGRPRQGIALFLCIAFLATPVFHRQYLAVGYAPGASDAVFRQVLAFLPEDAAVIVPGETRRDGLDPSSRYRYVAWEEFPGRGASIPGYRVVSAAAFLEFVRVERRIPGVDELDLDAEGTREGGTRWFYFRSGECLVAHGFDARSAQDPGSCRGLEEVLELEPVETWPVPFRDHRLVTQPRERRRPKFDDDFAFVLYRVRGLRPLR